METPLPVDLLTFKGSKVENLHVYTENYKAPTVEAMDAYMLKTE